MFREEKAAGKQKVAKAKEAPKPTNPYAWQASIKCFKCNQMGHRSNDCSLRKVVHLVEKEDRDDNDVCCEPDSYRDDDEFYKEDDNEGQNYVVRKLIRMPK